MSQISCPWKQPNLDRLYSNRKTTCRRAHEGAWTSKIRAIRRVGLRRMSLGRWRNLQDDKSRLENENIISDRPSWKRYPQKVLKNRTGCTLVGVIHVLSLGTLAGRGSFILDHDRFEHTRAGWYNVLATHRSKSGDIGHRQVSWIKCHSLFLSKMCGHPWIMSQKFTWIPRIEQDEKLIIHR